MAKLISSKHLESVSDLTLTAPIKQGFIDAFEAVTYETRLSKLLEALFKIRSTAREHSTIKPFVDTAERIQSLLDYRLAILNDTEPHQLLLSATFDKPFEPYMRLIWDPLGPLLDVIFCNCEDYVTATGNPFRDYLAWVRSAQIDTNFFYSANGLSIADIDYLLSLDRLERESSSGLERAGGSAPFSRAAIRVSDPEEAARNVREQQKDESNLLGLEALVSLYRLTDFYPPDKPDGDGHLLRRATQQLLRGWGRDLPPLWEQKLIPEQLAWFRKGLDEAQDRPGGSGTAWASGTEEEKGKWEAGRLAEGKGEPQQERLQFAPGDIQGGILTGYGTTAQPVRHGALLLMRIVDPQKARAFIGNLPAQAEDGHPIQARPAEGQTPAEGVFLNLAFTCRGLASIGVPEAELARFPQEFREGMEERAGLLGDVRGSHPRNWALPDRNWPGARREGAPALPVDMSEIDFVIQLRTTTDHASEDVIGDAGHPLYDEVRRLGANPEGSGVSLLAVQPMRRADRSADEFGREHFGYRDGISQPKPVDGAPGDGEVRRGEVLLGYWNDRSDPPPPASEITDNGTFLVVRKLRQDVGGLRAFVKQAAIEKGIPEDILYAKMMGRTADGDPLPKGPSAFFNQFGFEPDAHGQECPFQSHVRRSNPRARLEGASRPSPRILRRGMSYGVGLPREGQGAADTARGIVFMAYNASIAEQYEVIQRWVNGGNSTGVASWNNDPLMGVPSDNGPRIFRFSYSPGVERAEGEPQGPEEQGARRDIEIVLPQAFVALQWGMYLFVPSIKAIDAIVNRPERPLQAAMRAESEAVERGKEIVARLLKQAGEGPDGRRAAAAAWKICLEDFSAKDPAEKAEAPAIWAAIRRCHGGALRVPYGMVEPGQSPEEVVLVAGKELVMRAFRDPGGNYSMRGQMVRMKNSFGEIFLGMDRTGPNGDYDVKSKANEPILAIKERDAFNVARTVANKYLKEVHEVAPPFPGKLPEIDLRREFITGVLAGICHYWFGIPDSARPGESQYVDPLGWAWQPAAERHPRCPGDFMATSRYCFYPDPVPAVQAYGQAQGQALRFAVRNYLDAMRGPDKMLSGTLSEIISKLEAPGGGLAYPTNDELARTIIGVMTGFLPPADGCMRWALYEWIQEKTLWRVQQDLLSHPSGDPFVRAEEKLRPWLERAMQKRPAPDLLWRTALSDHQVGGETVAAGERIVIGIVSALAEDAASCMTDVYPIFGGNREPHDGTLAPVHACPAYKAAMGTMLGMLSALLESGRIETLPAPLLVKLDMELGLPRIEAEIAAADKALAAEAAARAEAATAASAAAAAAAGGAGG
jgi:Dyp-type peroxidase family